MDKYDIQIIYDYIIEKIYSFKESYNEGILYKKYLLFKKDYLMRKYYYLRLKRYNKKNKLFSIKPIEKVFTLDMRNKYAWEIFEPIKENKKEA